MKRGTAALSQIEVLSGFAYLSSCCPSQVQAHRIGPEHPVHKDCPRCSVPTYSCNPRFNPRGNALCQVHYSCFYRALLFTATSFTTHHRR